MAKNILEELEWVEEKLLQIKTWVDDNPLHLVKDRTITKYSKNGDPYEDVVQKEEAIRTSLMSAYKEYVNLLAQVDKLREEEKKKEVEARGNTKMNDRMKKLTKGDK